MKKHLLLLLGIFAFALSQVSAHVIIVEGGGKDHLYNYVKSTSRRTECRGTGHNPCLSQIGCIGAIRITYQEVLDAVLERFDKGETKGTMTYGDVIPVSWQINLKKELEVNIDDSKYVDR
ncbi:MAG: hypothetical protein IPP51_11930 [Bacteroidetes bacterium]|nr:hypothetical protein [Bacteroidota bacterium]